MKFSFSEFEMLQNRLAKSAGTAAQLDENQKEAFEERAAILEFCAGLARQEAERLALAMLNPHPPP